MNTLLSYVHILGCIGWTIFGSVLALDKNERMFQGEALVATIALLITTGTGIYLFAIGRNRQFTRLQQLGLDNSILQKQIEHAKLRQQLEATEKVGKE